MEEWKIKVLCLADLIRTKPAEQHIEHHEEWIVKNGKKLVEEFLVWYFNGTKTEEAIRQVVGAALSIKEE